MFAELPFGLLQYDFVSTFDNKEIRFTVSIGVVSYDPQEDLEKVDLVKRADSALYEAKKAGKNRFCIYNNDQNTMNIANSARK